MGGDAQEEEVMKLRDAPALSRRFRIAGTEDVYILVTPRCWPSRIAPIAGDQTPRPALYVQAGRTKNPDCEEAIHEFVIPRPTPEHVAAFIEFAEAETPDERKRAKEIWSRLVAWHGERKR
jgi:hypothetical protein